MVTRSVFDALRNYHQTSDGIGTHQAAKLRGAVIEVDRRAAVASDDGHLRATVVTDTHLLDFIFIVRQKLRLAEGGKKEEDSPLFAAVELEVGMRFRGNTQFASAVGLVLGLLCAVEAAKGN